MYDKNITSHQMGFLFVECFLYSRGITDKVADPKLILGVALKSAATGIILAHNHPSGNLQPSIEDKEIFKKIQSACKLLDITLLDHLIVVPEDVYFSFADEGIL